MGKQKYRKNNLNLAVERLAEILIAQANFKKNKVKKIQIKNGSIGHKKLTKKLSSKLL